MKVSSVNIEPCDMDWPIDIQTTGFKISHLICFLFLIVSAIMIYWLISNRSENSLIRTKDIKVSNQVETI